MEVQLLPTVFVFSRGLVTFTGNFALNLGATGGRVGISLWIHSPLTHDMLPEVVAAVTGNVFRGETRLPHRRTTPTDPGIWEFFNEQALS